MDVFSVVGVMIIVIMLAFLGKILSFIGRFVFMALIVVLVLVLVFGVSLDQVLNWAADVVMLAF